MPKEKKDEAMTGDDLQKSLDKLEEIATNDDPMARKDALLAKAQEGDLEKAERDELFALMGGVTVTDDTDTTTVGDDLVKSMTEGVTQDSQEALDVSPYLREQYEGLQKSLQAVGDVIEKSDKRHQDLSLLQSRALVEMGTLVKGLSERLGIIEKQPVRGPKSAGVGADQTLTKSFAGDGGDGDGDQLSKSEIADALDALMIESMEKGRNGQSEKNQDINLEISKFEQMSKLSPTMFGEVKSFIDRRNAAH